METAKRIAALLILVILVIVPAQSMDKPTGSDTLRASCLLKVTADPAVLPLDFETVDYLMRSTGVAGKATRDVLHVPLDELPDDFLTVEELSYGSTGTGSWGLPPMPSGTGFGSLGDVDAAGVESVDLTDSTGLDDYELMEESPATTDLAEPKDWRSTTSSRYGRGLYTSSRRSGRGRLRTGASGYSDYSRSTRRGSSYGERAPRTAAGTAQVSAEQTGLFLLSVDLPDEFPPLAEELMAAIVKNFDRALMEAFGGYRNRLDSASSLAAEEAERAEKELVHMQAGLRKLSGPYGHLSRRAILADIDRLRSDLQRITMDWASSDVIAKATSERIAEIRATIGKQLEDDEITRELERIVQISEDQLAVMEGEHRAGRIRSSELGPAKMDLAQARIELAKRREQMSKSTGGDLISSLNKELADLSINVIQDEAQIASIEEQLKKARDLLELADEYERDSLKADIAKRHLEEAIVLREQIARKSRLIQPPSVSVIGGD